MSRLIDKIQAEDATGFTHGGKFHADDVFSAALLRLLNPEIVISRGNKVPDDYEGIIFDIGRGEYDHHQRDSRVRDNGIPYAAFGLLWEELGTEFLSEEQAVKFDEDFIQPLDLNDNTGEKNELANLIGDFNPSWDDQADESRDLAFAQAVGIAEMVLQNRFARLHGNEKADTMVAEYIEEAEKKDDTLKKDHTLVIPQFVPFHKALTDTEVEFVIFPSNRGGYCIQPLKKQNSMNYRCCFQTEWLGLDKEELQNVSGLSSAVFCHKSGFIMTVGDLEEAKEACRISRERYVEQPVIVWLHEVAKDMTKDMTKGTDLLTKDLILEKMKAEEAFSQAQLEEMSFDALPALTENTFSEVIMEKEDWCERYKNLIGDVLKRKPEAVIVSGSMAVTYPAIHMLRKKHVPVYVPEQTTGEVRLVRIPSGS